MKVYVGFVDGRPLREPFAEYGVKMIAVFTSKRAARKCFQDVRQFELVLSSQKDRKATNG